MKLLTKAIKDKLLKNSKEAKAANGAYLDHAPAVKFFNPCGPATWLFSELDEDGDTLFGLCDMGFGTPELGYASLQELASIRLQFGLTIERDLNFKATGPMSAFAAAARGKGHIVSFLPKNLPAPSPQA